MASCIEAPGLLDRRLDILGDDAVQAFVLAQQFVWNALADRRLSLRVERDEGWSEAFREQRAELKRVAEGRAQHPLAAVWQAADGSAIVTKISSPQYLARCAHWAVKIDAPDFVTVPLAVTWLDADGATEAAERFIAGIAANRGLVRKNA